MPLGWSTAADAGGEVRLTCPACTRAHARDIESRLDEEWWTVDAGRRVLVVDDDETVSLVVRVALEEVGYEVVSVRTGEEALERLASVRPDVAVIDVRLPGIDGWEVRAHLEEVHGGIPTVMLSASTVEAPAELACLSKPFDTDELVETVGRVRQAGVGRA